MGTTKNWSKLRFSGRVSSFCSNSDTRRVPVVTNLLTSIDYGHDRIVKRHTEPIHLCHRYTVMVNQVMVVMTKILRRHM